MSTHIQTLAEIERPKSRRRVRATMKYPHHQPVSLALAQFAQEKAELRERMQTRKVKL